MEQATVTTTQGKPHNIASLPNFHPAVFDRLLKIEDSYYSKWKTSQPPWQLRLVGGPGSGKASVTEKTPAQGTVLTRLQTSFAALAVEDLRNFVKTKPGSIVVSAFLSTPNLPLTTAFLREIQAQLQRHVDAQPTLHVVVPSPARLGRKDKDNPS